MEPVKLILPKGAMFSEVLGPGPLGKGIIDGHMKAQSSNLDSFLVRPRQSDTRDCNPVGCRTHYLGQIVRS